MNSLLLLLPQRYIFSSKSQPVQCMCNLKICCCCYHKGTYFQANHNEIRILLHYNVVVVATTKVHIFKQITTARAGIGQGFSLLLLPQRYIFSSKSQLQWIELIRRKSCCCYHKGTYFQANHNLFYTTLLYSCVVVATTKVHIFKQITTKGN